MGNLALKVEGLGKKYHIGKQHETYNTLRDSLSSAMLAPTRRVVGLLRGQSASASDLDQELWALKDIVFDVQYGEVVGIIGHNGAGKSTLLKVLSRITQPTTGYVEIMGRVGALLEVGTGFHEELTGRENIYLNGAILGMSRHEIKYKFDEMVDFAGVEKFIDTPVKHYSSGMKLRLGFSVAAHLEPEILVVDEVLAVGDAEFQKKCLGKMQSVAGEGRTVLFVSHNISAIMNLCPRCLLMNRGEIELDDTTPIVIDAYMQDSAYSSSHKIITETVNGIDPTIIDVTLANDQQATSIFTTHGLFSFATLCHLGSMPSDKASLGFTINDIMGTTIFASHSNQYTQSLADEKQVVFTATIPKLPLTAGFYALSLYLADGSYDHCVARDVLQFEVLWNKDIQINYPPQKSWGASFVPVQWTVTPKESA